MAELNLKNVDPIVLSTHYDPNENLRASYGGKVLDPSDTLLVGLASKPEDGPVEVCVQLLQPAEGPAIQACHEQYNQPLDWEPTADPPGHAHVWRETGHEYLVGIRRDPTPDDSATIEPVIHIKVKPIEDLPDPSAIAAKPAEDLPNPSTAP